MYQIVNHKIVITVALIPTPIFSFDISGSFLDFLGAFVSLLIVVIMPCDDH